MGGSREGTHLISTHPKLPLIYLEVRGHIVTSRVVRTLESGGYN